MAEISGEDFSSEPEFSPDGSKEDRTTASSVLDIVNMFRGKKPEGLEEEIFRILFESAEIATFTPQERIKYIHDMTTERDIRNQLAYARKEGREEGREEERATTARKLAELGVDPEIIEKATGIRMA